MTERKHNQGRPRSIPPELFVKVLRLRLGGMSYNQIAILLDEEDCLSTTRGSVERLVKGRSPYHDV